jgi:hypothetical protein
LAIYLLIIHTGLHAQDRKVPPEPERQLPGRDSVIIISSKPDNGIRDFHVDQEQIKMYIDYATGKDFPFTITFNNVTVKPKYIPSQRRYLLHLTLKEDTNTLVFSICSSQSADTVKAGAYFKIQETPVRATISCSRYSNDTLNFLNHKN